jgi:hypothetical protein
MSRPPDTTNDALGIRVWRWAPVPHPARLDWAAGLGTWIVDAPLGLFSPIITGWFAGLCHLRDIPGVQPAYRKFPEAEYELLVHAIDPKYDMGELVDLHDRRIIDPDTAGPTGFLLRPADIQYQWTGTTDAQAAEIGAAFVRAILDGEQIDRPVQEPAAALAYDVRWHRMLAATVEHYTTGHWPAPAGQA